MIGQANWAASQLRPDASFDVTDLSINMKHPQVKHLLEANKLIRKLISKYCGIVFLRLRDLRNLRLVTFTDASYANMSDGVSSVGGQIEFLVCQHQSCCPLAWSVNKIKRVVRSTIAAETLSMIDGLETAFYLGCILTEIIWQNKRENIMPIESLIDNKSLFDSIHSMTNDKRLRVDLATIKEMLDKKELCKVQWTPTGHQLSDCLTKKGASTRKLLEVITSGKLHY